MLRFFAKRQAVAGLLGILPALAWTIPFASAGPQATVASGTHESSAITDPVVGRINQEPVSAAEYRMIMERKTALVYSWFKAEKGIDDHAGYWSETSGPTGPLARLREMVGDELIRIKVIQCLAREKGLITDTSFAALQHDYARENARRRAALDGGEVVYGPEQYRRLAIYYYVRLGDLRHRLLQVLAQEAEPAVSEDEIKTYYNAHKTTLATPTLDAELKKRIRGALAAREAEKQVESLRTAAPVEWSVDLLHGITPRRDSAPSALPSDG